MTTNQTTLNFSNVQPKRMGESIDPLPEHLENRVAVDVEHKGLGSEAIAVGIAIADATGEWYLPFGHAEGRQHDPARVRAWARDKLSDKDLIFRAAKNDIEVLRRWGLDFEGMNCRPHEVQHAAALLDDRRRVFTLEALMQDRLKRGKVTTPIHVKFLWQLPGELASPYARGDARGTYDLDVAYASDIEAQGLGDVLELEDELIYCVLSMEREASPIDIPKLDRWIGEVQAAYVERIMELHRRTGLRINPDSGPDMVRLFKHLGRSFGHTLEGRPSFTDEFLKKHAYEAPEVLLAMEARDLASLLSKYLVKYRNALRSDGRLPYQLHQLRGDEYGTITGRFASSKVNIQQVYKPAKQRKQSPATAAWIVRELFVPNPGYLWLSADASQIEFRLFAHFSRSERLCREYNENPDIDFHDLVTEKILNNIMIRDHAKNFNFMKLFGGGIGKVMAMTGIDDEDKARELDNMYNREFPESRRLMNQAIRLAENRGYVKTLLGRRRRFQRGDRMYSALNAVIQGSAADINKLKLLELYNNRKLLQLILRITMHDEADGDVPDEKHAKMVGDMLNEQALKLRVPITWNYGVGANWKEAAA